MDGNFDLLLFMKVNSSVSPDNKGFNATEKKGIVECGKPSPETIKNNLL